MTPIPPRIPVSWLPSATKPGMKFLDSSYFKECDSHKRLPSTQQVKGLSTKAPSPQPDPVIFEELGLLVKFGPHVRVEEALCMWAIRNVFHDEVPVPEVYGWRVDASEVFIYMELIRGDTLKDRWDVLVHDDRVLICEQLRKIITTFRGLEQESQDGFVGSINRGALQDYVFECKPGGGPFASVAQFHDWFSQLPQLWLPQSKRILDPHRPYLPDDSTITFTHGDLHQGNILISQAGPPRILAIVDWAHGGWYPDYWEYCKTAYTSLCESEWLNRYVPTFLTPRTEEQEIFGEYCMAMGSV